MNDETQHIISGEGKIRFGTTIQATADYLARSQTTGSMVEEHEQSKPEETKRLIGYIDDNQPRGWCPHQTHMRQHTNQHCFRTCVWWRHQPRGRIRFGETIYGK